MSAEGTPRARSLTRTALGVFARPHSRLRGESAHPSRAGEPARENRRSSLGRWPHSPAQSTTGPRTARRHLKATAELNVREAGAQVNFRSIAASVDAVAGRRYAASLAAGYAAGALTTSAPRVGSGLRAAHRGRPRRGPQSTGHPPDSTELLTPPVRRRRSTRDKGAAGSQGSQAAAPVLRPADPDQTLQGRVALLLEPEGRSRMSDDDWTTA